MGDNILDRHRGAYKISGGQNGGLLILLGMFLAFFSILALLFISSAILAGIAGAAGFIGHVLITYQLRNDPSASTDYAVTRSLTLMLGFALVWILSGTIFLAFPALFVIGLIASILTGLYKIISLIFSHLERGLIVRYG